jgi:hypothetical protein
MPDNVAMSRYQVSRQSAIVTVGTTIPPTATSSTEVGFEDFAGGSFFVPSGSTITQITFYAARAKANNTLEPTTGPTPTYYALFTPSTNTGGSVAVALTVAAGNAYSLPPDLYGVGAFKMVASAGGPGTVELSLKG